MDGRERGKKVLHMHTRADNGNSNIIFKPLLSMLKLLLFLFSTAKWSCGYFSWFDLPMCSIFVEIIPRLLKSINALEQQLLEL